MELLVVYIWGLGVDFCSHDWYPCVFSTPVFECGTCHVGGLPFHGAASSSSSSSTIFIIRSLLPEAFMQQGIICNMTHGLTTKHFFLLYCLLPLHICCHFRNLLLSGCAPAHKDVLCDRCVEHNAQNTLIMAFFVLFFLRGGINYS